MPRSRSACRLQRQVAWGQGQGCPTAFHIHCGRRPAAGPPPPYTAAQHTATLIIIQSRAPLRTAPPPPVYGQMPGRWLNRWRLPCMAGRPLRRPPARCARWRTMYAAPVPRSGRHRARRYPHPACARLSVARTMVCWITASVHRVIPRARDVAGARAVALVLHKRVMHGIHYKARADVVPALSFLKGGAPLA